MSFLKDFKPEIKVFLIVVAVSAILTVGGILLLRGLSPVPITPTPPIVQQAPPSAPAPQPQILDTSNWQTYRNDEYGVEFKYPSDWYAGGSLRGDNQFLICLNPSGVAGDCTGLITVSWGVDFDERYQAIRNLFSEYSVQESTTQIGTEQAVLMKISGYPSGREGFSRELLTTHEGDVYTISMVSGEERVFEQILSTFRFIEVQSADIQPIEISTWKTVISEEEKEVAEYLQKNINDITREQLLWGDDFSVVRVVFYPDNKFIATLKSGSTAYFLGEYSLADGKGVKVSYIAGSFLYPPELLDELKHIHGFEKIEDSKLRFYRDDEIGFEIHIQPVSLS